MAEQELFDRLNVLLAKRGWSRNKLSRETGLNINTIQGYWVKKRIPRGDDLVKIAIALNSTAEYLITGKNPPSKIDNPIIFDILEILNRSTDEEIIEIRALIRSYILTYFRRRKSVKESFAAEDK